MALKICTKGHRFEKKSDCPVCPICSSEENKIIFGAEFPPIGAPAFRALDRLGIEKLQDLTKYTKKELLSLHGFGPKALKLISESLQDLGLSFAKDEE